MPLPQFSKEDLANASPEEISELAAACLSCLEPGHQRLELFTQLSRVCTLGCVEIVPLRIETDTEQVLLSRRAPNDTWWSNLWHIPGVILLPEDRENGSRSLMAPIRRAFLEDFGKSVSLANDPKLIDIKNRQSARGGELVVIYRADIEQVADFPDPAISKFFDIDAVVSSGFQDEIVDGSQAIIEQAVRDYRSNSGLKSFDS